MSQSSKRKTEVEISASGRRILFCERPDLNSSSDAPVFDLSKAPRLTAKTVAALCATHGLDTSKGVTVFTQFITRSDYYQQTTHQLTWVEYVVQAGKLLKINSGYSSK